MVTSPPAVSVLVTVYNRERFLAACLESILASSFCNFELLVVDDQSSDGSVAIAEKYAANDSRIKVFQNDRNLGDYPNRNRIAALAVGKYLKYVDADDLIYPYSIQVMVEAMERFPTAAFGLSWSVVDPPQPYPFILDPTAALGAHFLGRSPLGDGPTAGIIRRDVFESIGGFSGKQFVGDTELWLRLCSRWPLVSLPPSLVWWRRHEGQQMTMEDERPDVINLRFAVHESALLECGVLSQSDTRAALVRGRQHHARHLWSIAVRQRKPRLALRLFCASGLSLRDALRGMKPYS